MKNHFVTLILLLTAIIVKGQGVLSKPTYLNYGVDDDTKELILTSLDSLFNQLSNGKVDDGLLLLERSDLTASVLELFKPHKTQKEEAEHNRSNKQLINFYPISSSKYYLTIAFIDKSLQEHLNPKIFCLLNLIATTDEGNTKFSIPINYSTRYWESFKIGNIRYYSRNGINEERAYQFDEKNKEIASKLGVEPEHFDFYICDNYQEVLELLGLEYFSKYNGRYRDGYGVDSNTIFSIMGNEDFSHDIFHYYSGKVHERKNRNWIAEEGIAYLWGNAYYTDKEGEMISLKRLVETLKTYLMENSGTNLYELFKSNPKIFNDIASEVSVRSTIAGVIAEEVEKKNGLEGILKLINAGNSELIPNFLSVTDNEIGINKDNFNRKVLKLVYNF